MCGRAWSAINSPQIGIGDAAGVTVADRPLIRPRAWAAGELVTEIRQLDVGAVLEREASNTQPALPAALGAGEMHHGRRIIGQRQSAVGAWED
jgi:hypothetical protein